MQPGDLKPILTALVLPPAGPLLLALLALLLARRRRGVGLGLAALCVVLMLALCCNGVAVALARTILPQVAPAQLQQVQGAQAIVVLGGGVQEWAPEYGSAQLEDGAFARLRYGAWLARKTGKPLAYAGGQGWAAAAGQPAEAQVASRVVHEDYGLSLRWLDDRSRDTRENADFSARVMQPDGVRRVAVVTDAWHMPRAVHYFRAAGFEVVAAPMGFPYQRRGIMNWLPSAEGLTLSRQVLREWLALRVAAA